MVENTRQTTVVHFIADGEVREFNFKFQIFEAGDVDVYLDETLTDNGYNVSIDEGVGGKVVFNQPPANGTRITIIRNLDIKRTSDFQEGGAFRAKVINHELDYQVATLQQLDEKINRSMIYPPYVQDGVSMQLPLPSAGKALVWNQQATALTNSSINVDNTIGEVTALQQKTEKSAEKVAKNLQQILQQSAETAINSQKAQEAADKAMYASWGNIGDIKYTTRTEVPVGGAWCDGTEYTQAMFPDIYQMLIDGKIQSLSYAEYDERISTDGYCEFLGFDSSTTSFKVPTLPDKYVVDTNTTSPVLGNGNALGFQVASGVRYAFGGSASGEAIIGRSRSSGKVGNTGTTTTNDEDIGKLVGIATDASKSGIIADTSNLSKVITLKAYVVLYSSAAEASVAQAAEFINALTNKANSDLSNISNNIDYVVESGSSGVQWYRKYKSGWLEQGGESGSVSGTSKTITLLKPLQNTSGAIALANDDYTPTNAYTLDIKLTTTAITLGRTGSAFFPFRWYVAGQGAE